MAEGVREQIRNRQPSQVRPAGRLEVIVYCCRKRNRNNLRFAGMAEAQGLRKKIRLQSQIENQAFAGILGRFSSFSALRATSPRSSASIFRKISPKNSSCQTSIFWEFTRCSMGMKNSIVLPSLNS